MAIPVENSVFKGTVPCQLAIEKEDTIICSKYSENGKDCVGKDDCGFYIPKFPNNFSDYSQRGLKTEWVKNSDKNSYWFECGHCHCRTPRTQYGNEYFSKYCPNCGFRIYEPTEEMTSVPTGIYQHFKGRYYNVLGTAEHTETEELLVVYQALYGKYKLYVRPLKMFAEIVEDLANGYRGPRFYKVDLQEE